MRTNGRPSLTRAIFEDEAVAAVIGFILVFAAALTYYAHVARDDVPQWGVESERAWDVNVGDALSKVSRAAVSAIGTDSTVAGWVPPTPVARALDIPLIRSVGPIPATGSVAFAPGCGGFEATHTSGNQSVSDLAISETGCLIFSADAPYGDDFGYDVELGGLVRIQEGRAVILSGPGLELRDLGSHHRASLTIMRLTGPSSSAFSGPTGVAFDLVPGPSSLDVATEPNAANATWTFTSRHPEAWKDWFETQIRASQFPSTSFVCNQDVTRLECASLGPNETRVVLDGPGVGTTPDLVVSISYAQYALGMG